jgi:hypothetical protein
MTLLVLIIDIVLTIPLSIIHNYLERHQVGSLPQILFPSIYIIILSALIPAVKENIFLIIIFEIFLRNFYITNITNENALNNTSYIGRDIVGILVGILTYSFFISKVNSVLPSAEEFKSFLWFIMIVYLISLLKNDTNFKKISEKKVETNHSEEYYLMQFAKYKTKYNYLIKSKDKMVNNLIYGIMIYESDHKPTIIRKIEEVGGNFTSREVKYGIMQIPSKIKLTDEETIVMSIKQLEHTFKNSKLSKENKIELALENKYQDNEATKDKIKQIYQYINKFTEN